MIVRSVVFASMALALMTADQAFAAGPSVGVEVGANINMVSLSGTDSAGVTKSSKTGLLAGVSFAAPVAPMISIQPEVAFAQKHFAVSNSGFAATEQWDFIEVPVLARIGKSVGGYVVVGPGFSLAARAKETDRIDGGVSQADQDVKDQIEKFDFSIIGGAGFAMKRVSIEGRVDAGLRNLNKDNNLGDLTIKDRTVSILARFGF